MPEHVWGPVNEKLKDEVTKQLKIKKDNKDCDDQGSISLILMDVSGSMTENNKFQDAKLSAANAIDAIKQQATQSAQSPEIGIMVFSGECVANPTTIVQPFSPDLEAVKASINKIPFPNGGTPLPQAIESARGKLEYQLNQTGQSCGSLIILGDGQSSCGAIRPPNSYVGKRTRKICGQQQGGKTTASVTFFTIGFGIAPGSEAERDFQYLSSVSGGKYFNAQDQYQLTRSLQKINQVYTPITAQQAKSTTALASDFFSSGCFYTITQQYDTALILFKKYIGLYPSDSSALYNYALMCEANERYKSAAKYYELYLQSAPNDPNRQAILDKIVLLKKDYDIYVAYTKQVILSDLAYLNLHFQKLQTAPDGVPLAGEFAGFIDEKQTFYQNLPETLEMDDAWLKQYSKEITQALKQANYFLSKNPKQWDLDGIAMIGNVYEPLSRLSKKLGQ